MSTSAETAARATLRQLWPLVRPHRRPLTAAAVLGHNFPDSQWYQDSYALLNKGGLQPSENQGSWISRVFRGGADA